jgi:hypothetical protein
MLSGFLSLFLMKLKNFLKIEHKIKDNSVG